MNHMLGLIIFEGLFMYKFQISYTKSIYYNRENMIEYK